MTVSSWLVKTFEVERLYWNIEKDRAKTDYICLWGRNLGVKVCVSKEKQFLFCFSKKGNHLKLTWLGRTIIMGLKWSLSR